MENEKQLGRQFQILENASNGWNKENIDLSGEERDHMKMLPYISLPRLSLREISDFGVQFKNDSPSTSSEQNIDLSSEQSSQMKMGPYISLQRLSPSEFSNLETEFRNDTPSTSFNSRFLGDHVQCIIHTTPGWTWRGAPCMRSVLTQGGYKRKCKSYREVHHSSGASLRVGDCAFVKSGIERPYIGKIESLHEVTGNKMATVIWFYWPEDTLKGRKRNQDKNELYFSDHRNVVNLQCIEDRCYVLDYYQYCYHVKRISAQNCKLSVRLPPPGTFIDHQWCRDKQIILPANISMKNIFYYQRKYNPKKGILLGLEQFL